MLTIIVVVWAQNMLLKSSLLHYQRLPTDFSPALLARELDTMSRDRDTIVFLGDSVLWGYQIPANENAVSILSARGCTCWNLAFKGGGPANFYVLSLLLAAHHVHPRLVVVEVNQRVFNAADPAYGTLHPAVDALGRAELPPGDLAIFPSGPAPAPVLRNLDAVASRMSRMYAMRSDLRAYLFGDTDEAKGPPPSADQFEGTYDLGAYQKSNLSVRFSIEALTVLRKSRIPVLAFMTPTNHRLVHDFIDNVSYRQNARFLRETFMDSGARVIDLDERFPADVFIDNDHLEVNGQRMLADSLQQAVLAALRR
jgi:hypothetical protein